jgi:hypothetical protein
VAPGRDGDKFSERPSAVTLIDRDYRTAKTSVHADIRKLDSNAAIYMRADETLGHPQTATLDIVRTVGPGAHKVLAFPARFSGIDLAVAGEAPVLGAHTDEIAGELGVNEPALVVLGPARWCSSAFCRGPLAKTLSPSSPCTSMHVARNPDLFRASDPGRAAPLS